MSYDLNFWKPDGKSDLKPSEIYNRLSNEEKVNGLVELPIKQICTLIVEAFPEADDSDPPRITFKNGSVDITLCQSFVRFDFYGHPPKRARDILTAIMAGHGCSMYDAQSESWYNHEEVLYLANMSSSEFSVTINDLLHQAAEAVGDQLVAAPQELKVRDVTASDLEKTQRLPGHAADVDRQCSECGYAKIGDFFAEDLGVLIRAWYGDPNIFVCSYAHQLLGLEWEEIIVFYDDQTQESWSNWRVDPLTPPWITRVVQQGPLLDLHEMMLSGRSDKLRAELTPDDFLSTLGAVYAREQIWRQSR